MNRIVQEQNARTYVLFIVAVIFLPISFVTGLFGMNVAGLPGAWKRPLLSCSLPLVWPSLWWHSVVFQIQEVVLIAGSSFCVPDEPQFAVHVYIALREGDDNAGFVEQFIYPVADV